MKLKKILAGVMAFVTAAACIPITRTYAMVGDEWVYGDYVCREVYGGDENYWNDLDVEIIKYLGDDKDVVIPTEINGHKVISISGNSRMSFDYQGGAFKNCVHITSITIPDTIENIDEGAFEGCTSITSITIPSSVQRITVGDDWQGSIHLSNVFGNCTSLVSINVDEDNPNYTSIDGVLFDKERKNLLAYPGGKKDSTYKIPDGTESCSLRAFDKGNQNIDNLIVPASMHFLPILHGSPFINEFPSLVSITVEEGNERYCSVDGVLFNKEKTELMMYPNRKTDTSYIVPNSVTNIYESALSECESITSITLPSSVAYLEGLSLTYNPSLTSVTIFGTPFANVYDFEGCREDMIIYGIPGSEIEEIAKEKNITFIPLSILEDDSTDVSVTGNLPEGVLLKVEKTSSEDTYIGYNITIVDGEGKEIQPSCVVEASLPVPETFNGEDCIVYRKEADGTYTDMKAVYKDGYMIFTTDHFSEYVLSIEPLSDDENGENTSSTTENPSPADSENGENSASTSNQPVNSDTETDNSNNNGEKPDNNVNTGLAVCIVPALIAATGVVIAKKRK